MRALLVLGVVSGGLAVSGAAAAWDFRSADGSVYCRVEFPGNQMALRCVRPRNGFWIRIADVFGKVRISTGMARRFVGVRDRRAYRVPLGGGWTSSDARGISCWSFPHGFTCKEYSGPSFWIGRSHGFRIFRDRPGYKPDVTPLFRTSFGVWCGIQADVLENVGRVLECWRARDGREFSLAPGGPYSSLRPKARGYRPLGFPLLPRRGVFTWRCRNPDEAGQRCSRERGELVFSCRSEGSRLTCENRKGRGFWITPTRSRTL